MRRGKGLRPFPHTPFLACASLPPLRSGQVFLDEAEHLFHNQGASDAALRGLFAFGPESRSRSLRNHRSPSPESSQSVKIRSNPDLSRHRAGFSGTGRATVGDQLSDGLACLGEDHLIALLHFFDQRGELGLGLRNATHHQASTIAKTRSGLVLLGRRTKRTGVPLPPLAPGKAVPASGWTWVFP